jgi:thiol-disulfide isomerase/thioredoxin
MFSWVKRNPFKLVLILIFTLSLVWLGATTVQAQTENADHPIIYLFWGDGCPHCAAEKPFLEELAAANPSIEIRAYEVWSSDSNRELMFKMAAAYGFEPTGVPTTFIGAQHWVGFSDVIQEQMQAAVEACLANGCPDAGAGIIDGSTPAAVTGPKQPAVVDPNASYIDIPLLGRVDLNAQSLTISTLLISFVDGFNPCSLWVLSMLMALAIHTGSRKKVLLIGLIFLTVTAGIYALFIAGLFSVLKVVSFVGWIQIVVALVAFVMAVINIKDYFFYKEGVSLTISEKDRNSLLPKMRNVLEKSDNIWGLAGATIVLSAGVSLVEFSCTAGFPVLWSNLMTAHNVSTGTFIGLLILYMIIYQLDEMAIFGTVVVTLKSSRLEEKHGRILKLIGGALMLTLAIVMLINPKIMNNLGSSLLVFGIAFAFAGFILLLHRVILPKFGIHIGTEFGRKKRKHR